MTHITPYLRYLAILPDYGPTMGLRWASGGEAIEMADGRTFFVKAGLPRFLEGFASQRPLIHFVYILELLQLLSHREERPSGVNKVLAARVCEAFRGEGLPLRNAGAFFGVICRDVPQTNTLDSEHLNLAKWLTTRPVLDLAWENDEDPPLKPEIFHRLLEENLAKYNEEELRHWFRHGKGPIYLVGKRLAEEVVNVKPPAPRGNLDDLVRERPRLAGALPLVGTMIGALSLPPRTRTPPQLPLGGYADVTTRGDPERLLPSQFALDADEFVRRFAEKELLFFQREEPPQRTRESLVLLVDQGVRTWGTVRLALSAAVLAFRKLAERRKQPWLVRFSSAITDRIDPDAGDPKVVADRLEASDLSASPATLLQAETANELAEDADIVLLTHPLSLHDQSVHTAGLDLPASKRLFALAVDEEGAAQFSHVRHGESVPISRFRVQFREPEVEQPLPPLPTDNRMWTGDVEPVPFPFAIGPFRNLVALDFDAGTTHLLAATQKGYLHLWNLHDGRLQMLPRAFQNGQVLFEPETVIGMHGGFVVGGVLDGEIVGAHYDFHQRTVKVYKAGRKDDGARYWFGIPKQRTILIRRQDGQATVLDSIKLDSKEEETTKKESISSLALNAMNRLQIPSWTPVFEKGTAPSSAPLPHVELEDGEVALCAGFQKMTAPLEEDGRRVNLRGRQCRAQFAGSTMALAVDDVQGDGVAWRMLDMNEERLMGKFDSKKVHTRMCRLSPDGQLFAIVSSHAKINVRIVGEASLCRLATAPGRVHSRLAIRLYPTFMRITIGSRSHSLDWGSGSLVHKFHSKWDKDPAGSFHADKRQPHALAQYDPSRFVSVICGHLDVLVDIAGHVIIYNPRRKEVVCVCLPRREHLAIWLPDGTRYGPADLIGGPSTPDAFERIGHALRDASTEGGA